MTRLRLPPSYACFAHRPTSSAGATKYAHQDPYEHSHPLLQATQIRPLALVDKHFRGGLAYLNCSPSMLNTPFIPPSPSPVQPHPHPRHRSRQLQSLPQCRSPKVLRLDLSPPTCILRAHSSNLDQESLPVPGNPSASSRRTPAPNRSLCPPPASTCVTFPVSPKTPNNRPRCSILPFYPPNLARECQFPVVKAGNSGSTARFKMRRVP